MSYVAAVCGKGQEVNKVKEQLLQSNPVLEGESQVHVCSLECLVAGWLSVCDMWLNYPVAKHCPPFKSRATQQYSYCDAQFEYPT